MPSAETELVLRAWVPFSRGDEGGCRNRGQATAFIRQTLADGVGVEPAHARSAGRRTRR